MSPKVHIWIKGGIAAAISGCFGGIVTALSAGIHAAKPILLSICTSAAIGVAAYLKQSPLPNGSAQ